MKCLTSDISQHILILSLFTVDIFKVQVFFWVDVHRYTGTDNTDTWAHVIKSSAAEVNHFENIIVSINLLLLQPV